ncbi:MAG TPA: hypothetical protein VNI83_02185 [Vicinamibacterales bacterium]|nr:hypothetical protein [Vicinamibacterales bacterium]
MPLVTGPELDKIVAEAREWYATTRQWLIEQLSEGYPYGTKPLSPIEQLMRYMEVRMDPQAWRALVMMLEDRYRGLPDARDRVERDLQAYVRRMEALRQRLSAGNEL